MLKTSFDWPPQVDSDLSSSVGGVCSESYLAGVTEDGLPHCGNSRFPKMFTSVFPHVDWITVMMRVDPTTNPVQSTS